MSLFTPLWLCIFIIFKLFSLQDIRSMPILNEKSAIPTLQDVHQKKEMKQSTKAFISHQTL